MTNDDTHGLGYVRVDADPNVSVLLATMDATAGWEARGGSPRDLP